MSFSDGGTGFQNPVVGGGGELVIDNIHSREFQTGLQGWIIRRDGTSEFQDVTVRGTYTAVDGNNELRISATNAPWTFDPAISLNPQRFVFAPGLVQGIETFGTELVGSTYIRSPFPVNSGTLAAEGDPSIVELISDTRGTFAGKRVEITADQVTLISGTNLDIQGGDLNLTGDLNFTGDNIGQERMFRSFANTTRNNSTVPLNINGMTVPVSANGFYTFRSFIVYVSATAAPNLRLEFSTPVGAVQSWTPAGLDFGTTTDTDAIRLPNANTWRQIGTAPGIELVALVTGYLQTGANAGDFIMQMAQAVAQPENTQVLAGSHLIIKRWS